MSDVYLSDSGAKWQFEGPPQIAPEKLRLYLHLNLLADVYNSLQTRCVLNKLYNLHPKQKPKLMLTCVTCVYSSVSVTQSDSFIHLVK